MGIAELRREYHRNICLKVVRVRPEEGKEYPNFADVSSKASIKISQGILQRLGFELVYGVQKEQTTGDLFEQVTKQFIQDSFSLLNHLRPGEWSYSTLGTEISRFEQYEHLATLAHLIKDHKELSTTLGRDYIVRPDIVVGRSSVNDDKINEKEQIIGEHDRTVAGLTPFRSINQGDKPRPSLHASISCKWTIRSDRSQNTRTEALNLIRNRKGNLPHIVAVTAEPLPTRIAALALGTGDLDCVYHFALKELQETIIDLQNEDQKDILDMMVDGKRLRDISDLPFDLAV